MRLIDPHDLQTTARGRLAVAIDLHARKLAFAFHLFSLLYPQQALRVDSVPFLRMRAIELLFTTGVSQLTDQRRIEWKISARVS